MSGSLILVAKNDIAVCILGLALRHKKRDISVEHLGIKEMWADGNTKPLQGAGFRLFRSKIMGISENYDDNEERRRTHLLLLPKPEKAGVVSQEDLKLRVKTMGVANSGKELFKVSTPPLTDAKVRRRSVLDGKRYGHGNRPHWEMKEGQERSRYLNLIRALARELDPSRRRQI